eukprot:c20297_g1_i2.p1 GENE.c20297_g1_i2~~c20297_g1_i2.p1  ORF type:complete len:633 (+),score=132.32 c20297_g1_i2:1-1899(+)
MGTPTGVWMSAEKDRRLVLAALGLAGMLLVIWSKRQKHAKLEQERARIVAAQRRGRRTSAGYLERCMEILTQMLQDAPPSQKKDIEYVMDALARTEVVSLEASVTKNARLEDTTKKWIVSEFSQRDQASEVVATPPRKPSLARAHSAMVIARGNVASALESVDDFVRFDIFAFAKASEGAPLRTIGWFLMHRWGFVHQFRIDVKKLEAFLEEVEANYNKQNPYHNNTHAADVTQAVHSLLLLGMKAYFTDLEVFSMLLSAMTHDVGHDGLTNAYHVITMSERAVQHNMNSVQESHHSSLTLQLLKKDSTNILSNMPPEEATQVRRMIVDCVLATDMSAHSRYERELKLECQARGRSPDAWPIADRKILRTMLLHLADLSNPLRPTPLASKWAKLLLEEFFAQGDLELSMELPISPLCDRRATELANSQLGFLQHVIMPFLTTFALVMPEIQKTIVPVARKNLTFWEYQKDPMLNRRTLSQDLPRRTNKESQATPSSPATSNDGHNKSDGQGNDNDSDTSSGSGSEPTAPTPNNEPKQLTRLTIEDNKTSTNTNNNNDDNSDSSTDERNHKPTPPNAEDNDNDNESDNRSRVRPDAYDSEQQRQEELERQRQAQDQTPKVTFATPIGTDISKD